MNYRFTIIVPVYNEADNLLRVEQELADYVKLTSISTKVLFINDGSSDDSQSLLESICQRHNYFDFLQLKENQGLSAAIKVGFDHVNTELVGYIDADLQTTPKDFDLLLAHMDNYDLVTGVRHNRKDSIIKKLSSRIANVIRRFFTKDGMDDTGCPLKVIRTDYAKRIPMFKGLHRFLPAMILLQDGRIKQVPIQHFPRVAGNSKFGLRKRLLSPLTDCFAYLWMKRKTIRYDIKNKSF